MIQRSCRQCGKQFPIDAAQLKYEGYGQFCSRRCMYDSLKKEVRAPRVSDGRVMIYAPQSPMAGKDGYVYRYRLVMAEKLGRPLTSEEVVHHLNGDSLNDHPDNLVVTASLREHALVHHRERATSEGYDALTQRRCGRCRLIKLRTDFSSVTGYCKPCAAKWQRERRKKGVGHAK